MSGVRIDGHHAGLPYHLELLSDPWRLTAWKRAIQAVITPGDTVLDVGTGTGLMAVWAAQAGAARVIAVESADVAAIARETMARNGLQDVVQVHHADLATLEPEPVDVILADFVGRLGPDAAMLRAMRAAAAWACPSTRWLPQEVRLKMAAVGDLAVPGLDRWEHDLLGVDLGAARDEAGRVPWTVQLAADALAGPSVPVSTLRPDTLDEVMSIDARLPVTQACTTRGAVAWFEATLAPGVVLDTGPGRRTFWGQVLCSMPTANLPANASLQVTLKVHAVPGGVDLTWSISTEPESRPVQRDRPPAGRPRLALPELLAEGIPTDRETLAELILALYQIGDPQAGPLLSSYERRFGPHPTLRRS